MLNKFLTYCASLSIRYVFVYGIILGIAFEALTLCLRFGLQMESTRDTSAVGSFTCGLRVHHGYIGLFLGLLAWCAPRGLRHALWMIAIGLVLSDLAHHFLVLWPITGSPQFDLVYPDHPYWRKDSP